MNRFTFHTGWSCFLVGQDGSIGNHIWEKLTKCVPYCLCSWCDEWAGKRPVWFLVIQLVFRNLYPVLWVFGRSVLHSRRARGTRARWGPRSTRGQRVPRLQRWLFVILFVDWFTDLSCILFSTCHWSYQYSTKLAFGLLIFPITASVPNKIGKDSFTLTSLQPITSVAVCGGEHWGMCVLVSVGSAGASSIWRARKKLTHRTLVCGAVVPCQPQRQVLLASHYSSCAHDKCGWQRD